MAKLTKVNTGGNNNSFAGCVLTGVCASAADAYVKQVTLTDGDALSDGMGMVVTFANGNTAGIAPGSMTIYSSDQVNYFEDAQLTIPFTLAPQGCYTIEYTGTSNAYTYTSYPVIQVGQISGPLCSANGKEYGGTAWSAGDTVLFLYTGGKFLMLNVGINVVQSGNTVPVSSGAVADSLFRLDRVQNLDTEGWYKIAVLGTRARGDNITLNIATSWWNNRSSAHNIQIAYGYKESINILEIAKDLDGVVDKIRYYYGDSDSVAGFILLHYTRNHYNTVWFNIRSNLYNQDIQIVNFETTDISQLDNNYKEFNLGIDGFYLNGYNRLPSAPSTDGAYNLQCSVESGVPTYSWGGIVDGATVRNLGGISTYTFTLPKVNKYRVLRGYFVGGDNRTMGFEVSYGWGQSNKMGIPDISFISDKLTMTYDRDACTITFSSSSEVFYACIYSIQAIEAYLGLPVTV